ncbi:DNA repair protein RecO [bioreactor metagenome]|jgi:DNA repair protein RecO (recombination protein O)|uniref:DNA repair protein RecO n=1 Tax=bioreactor metagenome TaxID=1076179 RepID=A0A644UX48_9ZZZZ|nr:DNA repair protein RecO [Lentimicrobium sp.]MEA5110643.1 DNA repair protein RecO [Lentimicrobium sp.]
MLISTHGIVFHTTRYADSGAVVKIYTEKFGLQSFLVKGLYSRKSKLKAALFSHLSILDLVIDHHGHRNLHYIREASVYIPLQRLQDDMSRSSLVLFINELLYKCIREEEPNPALFSYLVTVLQLLNEPGISLHSFHLLFMLRLTRFLGFSPRFAKAGSGEFFDMEEGLFLDSEPMHRYFISGPPAEALERLQLLEFQDLQGFEIPRSVRDTLLDRLIDFYRLHIPDLGEMKSVKVLQEILG